MTPDERVAEVLKTFEVGKVAMIVRKTGETWWFPRGERVPSKKDIQAKARQMLLELLADPTTTVAITSGGLIATRRGDRLGIAYCPVTSPDFP